LQFCSALQKGSYQAPTDPLGTIFAIPVAKNPIFSIHCSITAKLQNKKSKINQTVEFQGFGAFAVFFAVALQ
jgi:hypothetical protein